MLRHNFLIIYRNFKRFKSTFIINLIGLSTALACSLLIYLWVNDELSVDKFHKNDDRLYHIMEHRVKADGIWTSPTTSGPLAESLEAEMPEIEHVISSSWTQTVTFSVDGKNMKVKGRYAGKDFFNMFSFDLLEGNSDQVLKEKNSIVVSEKFAITLFNTTENIIGKTVKVALGDDYAVSGVFKDIPQTSTEQFDFVMTFEKFKERSPWVQQWGNTGIRTYVLLKKDADPGAFSKKIAGYVKLKTNNEITHRTPFLKRFSEIYLYGNYENGIQTGGRITYVKLFSIIAVFILIIAAINFMNLSTAKASRRIREVGIKKAVGAGRRILVFQYLSESLLMSLFSLLTAFLIVDLLLPQFNTIIGKHLTIHFDATLVGYSLAITLATGIIAGSYPAFYLSGFRPASVLKGQLNTSYGERWARKGLVVFQFTLSIIFIVSVLVVYKQIAFVQSTNLGYDKDNILYFSREGSMNEKSNFETLISEFRNIPGVLGASTTSHDMTGHNSGTYGVQWEGKNPEDKTEFENITVSDGMIETLGFTLTEGRSFSTAFGADTAKIIFSEAAIEFMGMKDPIGKTVKLWGKDRQIIGIVKNFHYESLHENFKPVFFRYDPENTYIAMVKLTRGAEKETVAKLEQLYKKLNPGFSFDYTFLDSDYNAQYIAEQRVSILSRYFAGLAVLISCLGLFGLAAFTAERRLKEIGIRKVLGASEFGIVFLLSGDFTKIVFTAIVISLPISYFFTSYWLDSFAFKISLEWWYFIGAGALSMIIAWLTVGTQSIKAARVNPVNCLKDE